MNPDPIATEGFKSALRYVLRQDPSPSNSLGLIKFMFPNEHNVYLHDTPTRGLFHRSGDAAQDHLAPQDACLRLRHGGLDLRMLRLPVASQAGRQVARADERQVHADWEKAMARLRHLLSDHLDLPQGGQAVSGVPHETQNCASEGLRVPHDGQLTALSG